MSASWPGQEITARVTSPRPVFTVPDPRGDAEERRQEAEERRAQATFDQRNAVVPTPGDTQLTGDDYLATLDLGLAGQVKALAEGRRAFPTGAALRDPRVQELIAAATQYDPTLDAANAATRVATRKNFTSGKARQNITAINTALGHLGSLSEAAEELDNSIFPLWNTIGNTAIQAVGDPRVNRFVITRDAVANELMRVFRQVGASTTEIQEWKETISSSDSPEQLKAEISQAVELLNSRLLAMQEEYQTGMGQSADVYEFLSPHAREVFDELLPGVLAAGTGGDGSGGDGPLPGAKINEQPIPGIREPTREEIYSGGVQWGDQTSGMQDSVAEYLAENYGVKPGQEAEINAFWNANRGNPELTVEGVKQWYARRGIGVPQDAAIAASIEMAMTPGVEFTGSGAEAAIAEYYDQLDQVLKQRGADPESLSGAIGINAAEGIFPLLDEAAGVGGMVKAGIEGQDPFAGYTTERDVIRREQSRAEEARPGTSVAANMAGMMATGGAGFSNAARLAKAAHTARRIGDTSRAASLARLARNAAGRTGAAYGAGYGFAEGEGALDSATGIPVGGAVGGAAGAAVQAFAPIVGRAVRKLVPHRVGKAGPTAVENYAAGQRYGMDLSVGDAGGMSPKIVERILDVQPGSGSVMNQGREALGEQMVEAVDDVAGTFGATTSFRGIGEAVQRGIKGWKGRFDKVAERAYQAIPIKGDIGAVVSNTVGALEQLTTRITSNPKLAAMLTDKRLVGYLEALRGQARSVPTGVLDAQGKPITREVTEGGSLSWNDLKQLRSRIGEEIGEQRFGEGTLKSDLRRLYAALSQDMEATARAQGPKALRSFERANNLYREGQSRLDRVWESILGPDGSKAPEAAAAIVQRIAKEGKSTGDLGKLAELRRTLSNDEWGEVSNGLLRLLGQPANSEGRAFAADTFVRNYADMAPEARNLLFGGENKALRQNLDEFARVVGLVGASKGTRNTSGTAMGLSGLVGYGIAGLPGALAQAVLSYGSAKLWTSPGFVRWATGYNKMMRAAAKGGRIDPKAHEGQMSALGRLAGANTVIAGEARDLQRQLAAQFEAGPLPLAAQEDRRASDPRRTAGGTR